MQQPADLVIENIIVITMDSTRPEAKGIAVFDGKIIGLLENDHTPWPLTPNGQRLDGKGMTLLPGLIDAHCHLRAQIGYNQAVRCGFPDVNSIDEIILLLRNQANKLENGTWIKANGYDPFYLKEQRHPTRWDLDCATEQHPIRLRHITRHVSVLNSKALSIAGIGPDSIDPPGITVERIGNSGIPTGIIYGGDAWLSQHFVTSASSEQLRKGAQKLHWQLISKGITSVHDATPTNTLTDLQFWIDCIKEFWSISISLMSNIQNHHILKEHYSKETTNEMITKLEMGPIKVVIENIPDLLPSPNELKMIAVEAAKRKIPLAIHVVTPEMVWAALDAIQYAKEVHPNDLVNRLEHLSLCPEGLLSDIEALNLLVVTNPSLIYDHGDRYLKNVDPTEHSWLYRMKSIQDYGIILAAGSDAPVATVDPWISIATACSRKTKSGQTLSLGEKLTRWDAIALYTTKAALAAGWETKRGMIRPNFHADFLLVNHHPLTCSLDNLYKMQVQQTWIDGQLVYEK
ncbi:amidohydrolase family protein [Bacillus sp. AGMB 02131]|uniref:Amidohydrolase family protein n=1 Tax=Peribacillus faecalis TaxID=2772559 RepID=A0A927CWN8_9BACI|nr:amidohydrolase family protein [Peribacillus faecalis]MBD3107335.1 amidohydrolase family protein [Peribacillus faecalis]